jgi:hypothetical protein
VILPKPSEPIHLVFVPTTASRTVPGSTFDRHCFRCQRRVMMAAPTGRAWLKTYPTSQILCILCYRDRPPDDGGRRTLAASPAEIAAELRTAVPNLWRQRN